MARQQNGDGSRTRSATDTEGREEPPKGKKRGRSCAESAHGSEKKSKTTPVTLVPTLAHHITVSHHVSRPGDEEGEEKGSPQPEVEMPTPGIKPTRPLVGQGKYSIARALGDKRGNVNNKMKQEFMSKCFHAERMKLVCIELRANTHRCCCLYCCCLSPISTELCNKKEMGKEHDMKKFDASYQYLMKEGILQKGRKKKEPRRIEISVEPLFEDTDAEKSDDSDCDDCNNKE